MARVLVLAVTLVLALLVSAAASSSTTAAACPRAALPIFGTNPVGAAIGAALRRVPKSDKPQVQGAFSAIADKSRGPQVGTQCGRQARTRTIVVYILRRAYLPAQSASSGVYYVSRFANGYRVWQVAH